MIVCVIPAGTKAEVDRPSPEHGYDVEELLARPAGSGTGRPLMGSAPAGVESGTPLELKASLLRQAAACGGPARPLSSEVIRRALHAYVHR